MTARKLSEEGSFLIWRHFSITLLIVSSLSGMIIFRRWIILSILRIKRSGLGFCRAFFAGPLSRNSSERKRKKHLRILVEQEWSFWGPIVFGQGFSYADMDLMDGLELECANIALDIKKELEKKAFEKAKREAKGR